MIGRRARCSRDLAEHFEPDIVAALVGDACIQALTVLEYTAGDEPVEILSQINAPAAVTVYVQSSSDENDTATAKLIT
jgi:hypothetical protein